MARRGNSAETIDEEYQVELRPYAEGYTVDESALPGTEWETVVEESATVILFDTVGDQWVGQFLGEEHIVPDNGSDEPFDRYTFRGQDGGLYAINKSYKLAQGMDKVGAGQWCRLTYVKDIPTGRKLNPMKDITVEVRR